MSERRFEDGAIRKEIIRAGATYPSAVSSSYFEPSSASASPAGGALKKGIASTCNRHTRPRPAFGATRHEGAIGPIGALSSYADVVDYNRRHIKNRTYFKRNCRNWLQASVQEYQTVTKGPTAETIISMTAAGRKPPVPEEAQVEIHKKTLSKISAYMASAVSGRITDNEQSFKSIHELEARTNTSSPDKIPGYWQTWGVAFSPQEFTPPIFPRGPGGARYPQNYPPGIMRFQ